MVLSPTEAQNSEEVQRIADFIEKKIDEVLKEGLTHLCFSFVDSNTYQSNTSATEPLKWYFYITEIKESDITEYVKKEISERYQKAGWADVYFDSRYIKGEKQPLKIDLRPKSSEILTS